MNKDFNSVIKNLQNLNFFNKKNSEIFSYSFLKDKEEYKKTFLKNLELLNDLEICSKCNTIRHINNCENCELKSETIYIFEDFSDFFALSQKLDKIEKSFILNIYSRNDYLNIDKLNNMIAKISDFLNENDLTKEIIFMISPSFESEVFKNELKNKLSKKILFNEIPLGIPLNSKIKYYDTNLLKELIYKNEKSK